MRFGQWYGIRLATTAIALAVISMTAFANQDQNGSAKAGIDVVTGDQYPPYVDPLLPNGGVLTQIVMRVLVEAEFAPKLTHVPWSRAYAHAKNGHHAALFPYIKTPEREADFLFSDAVISIKSYLYSNKPDVANLSLTALVGRSLCMPQGYVLPDSIRPLVGAGAITITAEPQQPYLCPVMIKRGRADAWIQDVLVESHLRATTGMPLLHRGQEPLGVSELHVLFPRALADSPANLQRFNAALARLTSDGTFSELLAPMGAGAEQQ